MPEFNEQSLLAAGIAEKQVQIIKSILTLEEITFDKVTFILNPFVAYKEPTTPYGPSGGIDHAKSIDFGIPFVMKNEKVRTKKEVHPAYIKVMLTCDFQHYHSHAYLLNLIHEQLPQKPFAYGIINKDKRINLEELAKTDKSPPLSDQAFTKRVYFLPSRDPFLALFFSVYGIGDTVIEIHNAKEM